MQEVSLPGASFGSLAAPRQTCWHGAGLAPRLKRIPLQEAAHPGSADAPGFRLHPLKGDRAGQLWGVRVSGNWRAVFRFEDGEAVDLIDYH